MSDVVAGYKGRVWWLPLGRATRKRVDLDALRIFLQAQEGRKYDFFQVARAGVKAATKRLFGRGFNLTPVQESNKRVFCSEYVALALAAAGVRCWPNCSTVTPAELATARIYADEYWQLKGEPKTLPRYNTQSATIGEE
jgi:hypothetical protein